MKTNDHDDEQKPKNSDPATGERGGGERARSAEAERRYELERQRTFIRCGGGVRIMRKRIGGA